MQIYSLLAVSVALCSLFVGVFILRLDLQEKTHRLFFCLAITGCIWNLLSGFLFSAPTEQSLWFWFRPAASMGIIFVPLILHFLLALTERNPTAWTLLALYTPSLPVHYRNWTSFFYFREAFRSGGTWIFPPAYDSFWFYYWGVYSHAILITSLFLLHIWGKRSKSIRVKKQARTILWSLLSFLVVASLVDNFIGPRIPMPGLTPVYFAAFLIGIATATAKYRFLSVTHATVSKDIIENLNAIVILLDPALNIVSMNPKAEAVLKLPAETMEGKPVCILLGSDNYIRESLQRITLGKSERFSCHLQLPRRPELTVLALTASRIMDRWGDLLGVLVLGQEVQEARHFVKRFHLTPREWQTIQYILTAASNKQIAGYLGITERTVKAHVTSVYGKLGITSRTGLLRLLSAMKLLEHDSSGP